MKKNTCVDGKVMLFLRWKIFLIMKLQLVFILGFLIQSHAIVSQAQNKRLTLRFENNSLKEVLQTLEDQTDFSFVYKDEQINTESKISGDFKDKSVNEVLDGVLKQSGLTYTIKGRAIVILPVMAVQQKTISGKVTDLSGQPLPGVSVVVNGTTHGIITDFDGNYTLTNVPGDATLVFSFVGMKTQAIIIKDKTLINVSLTEESIGVDEVVVVGYGIQKKVNLTGSVAAVKIDETMSSRSLSNVSSGLSGLVPGLTVAQTSSMAGNDGATLVIRGLGSPNNSNPLIVVDGMPDVDINKLNMNDIESVSVLKDAASSAIYGSRAANGVILITTKRGEKGDVQLNYTGSHSWRSFTNYPEMLPDYPLTREIHNMAYINGGKALRFTDGTIEQWMAMEHIDPVRFPNTDWWDIIFKTGHIQNHNVSASGGTEKMNFYISAGYMHDDGISINTDYSRKNFRLNLDYKINKSIKMGTNIDGTWTDESYGNPDGLNNMELANVRWDFIMTVPGITVMDSDGRYGGHMAYQENAISRNLYATLMSMHNIEQQQHLIGNFYSEWEALKGLTFRVDYGLNFLNRFSKSYTDPLVRWNFQTETPIDVITTNGGIYNGYTNNCKTLLQGRITYTKDLFKGHNLTALAVYTEEYWNGRWLSGSRQDRLHVALTELNAALNDRPATSGSSSGEGLRSAISRLNYNIKDKYLFEANVRADASSKFLSGYQWGVFPSFSTGWRISQENFFKPLSNVITSAKIRGSWGMLGNNSGVGRYEQQGAYILTNYSLGEKLASGVSSNKMINPDFTWEKTRVTNLGFDLTFLNKLNVELDLYDRLTNDIIRGSELSTLLSSAYDAPNTNIGELQNRGIELNLGWNDKIGKVAYNVHFNYSFNKNKLLSWNQRLGYGVPFLDYPYSFTRTYVASDIAQSWQDIYNAPYQGNDYFAPGDILYEDKNGDGQISDDDMVSLRNSPRSFFNSQYGLILNAKWKNFDVNCIFQASTGSKDFWLDQYNLVYPRDLRYIYNTVHLDSWNLDNRDSGLPRLVMNTGQGGRNSIPSTFWLYKRDFLRLKNIQIGYNLPKSVIDKVKLSNVRIYFSGENIFTLTSWPGIDPEKPGGGTQDNSNPYPLSKSYAFGINVTL